MLVRKDLESSPAVPASSPSSSALSTHGAWGAEPQSLPESNSPSSVPSLTVTHHLPAAMVSESSSPGRAHTGWLEARGAMGENWGAYSKSTVAEKSHLGNSYDQHQGPEI